MLYDPKWQETVTIPAEKQAILDAALLIERHGWCRHMAKPNNDTLVPHCILGALYEVTGGFNNGHNFYNKDVYHKSTDIVANRLGKPITYWNDILATSKEEVVAKLREIANAV